MEGKWDAICKKAVLAIFLRGCNPAARQQSKSFHCYGGESTIIFIFREIIRYFRLL